MNDLSILLAEVLSVSPAELNDETMLADMPSWNSLAHIELVVQLEDTFAIVLTQDDIVEMTNLRAIRAVLQRHGLSAVAGTVPA